MNEHQDEPEDKKPRLNLTTSQVAASALAACCASIVASFLGVAGTVIGAALGSVVATTGAAVYGHLFRRGGERIRQTLLVNGQQVEPGDDPAEATAATATTATTATTTKNAGAGAAGAAPRAGRFYGVQDDPAASAGPTARLDPTTRLLWTPSVAPTATTAIVQGGADDAEDPDEPSNDSLGPNAQPGAIFAIRRYRKPIGVAVALVAVFCISITVGILLGAPVRAAGSNAAPPAHSTPTSPATPHAHRTERQRQTSGTEPSRSASPGPSTGAGAAAGGGTPSPSGSPSPSTTPTPSAPPSQPSVPPSPTATPGTLKAGAGPTNTSTKTP